MKISVTYLAPTTTEIEVDEKFRTLVDYDKKWFETHSLTWEEETEGDKLLDNLFTLIYDILDINFDEISSISDESNYTFWDN